MVCGCAYGLGIIVRTFLSLFPHCELSHFSPSIYRQWVPLVSATPLTVLYRLFWNFAYVVFMVWGCAYGLDIIVRSLSLFPHCERSHFSSFICKQLVPLVSATPLTVLYQLLWNFACLFFMVWGYAYDLDVIVRLFFFHFFPHCELSHFLPSIYRQWVPREHSSSYNFILIFLALCTCFLYSLKMCMCYSYNPWFIFCHFFVIF